MEISLLQDRTRLEVTVWSISALITLYFIVFMAYLIMNNTAIRAKDHTIVNTSKAVKEYLKDNWVEKSPENSKKTTYLKTGVFIDSLTFSSPRVVELSGYVWQTYPKEYLNKNEIGITFPDAIKFKIEESYRHVHEKSNKTLIGWRFEGTFAQHFNYTQYPFNDKIVWLRIWPKKFNTINILEPDFKSYKIVHNFNKHGVDQDMSIGNFRLTATYFSYGSYKYGTTFGFNINSKFNDENRPVLYFNIQLERNNANAFISHFLPLIIVLILTFILLIGIHNNTHHKHVAPSGLFAVIMEVSPVLIFVILLDHTHITEILDTKQVVYLDYIYFIMYAAIIYVPVNLLIFFMLSDKYKILTWLYQHDALFIKAIFLPLVFGLFLITTLYCF